MNVPPEIWMYIIESIDEFYHPDLKVVSRDFRNYITEIENRRYLYPLNAMTVNDLIKRLQKYPKDAIVYAENFHHRTLNGKYYLKAIPSYHFCSITEKTRLGESQWSETSLPYISHQVIGRKKAKPADNVMVFFKGDDDSFFEKQPLRVYHSSHLQFKILIRDGVCFI